MPAGHPHRHPPLREAGLHRRRATARQEPRLHVLDATALGDWFTASLLPTQTSDGSLPGIAPTPPGNWIFDVPSPAWDAALFEIPATLLRHYADVATLRRALPAQRRYLDFLERRFPTGIIDTGLGDWNAPGHIAPPESPALLSTAYHHRFLRQFARALRIMDEPAAAAHHEARAAALARRFDAEFWRGDHWSASGEGEASGEAGGEGYRETSTVLPLAFGLALPERRDLAAARLVRELEARDRHLDTGIVGTRFLLPTLVRLGRCDLAFAVARQRDYPSWGWWLANGATTLYENWELDGRSHNHAMFGSIVGWLHADVAGLSPHAPGWDAVRVDPHLPAEKGFGCASALTTLAGEVSAEWERRGATISGRVLARTGVSVVVPEGARHTQRRTGRTTEHLIQLQS
ncbi:hypothetical protein ACSDQ9_04385 [Aestuariimicrobium soli]|uniref:alpha-L-rhamnosidase-related protein n=1 Tax=Aestuariimicrobium soli TaxID=2035834 RepID=UPI003EBDB90D